MINLLPEEEQQKKRSQKREEPRIEMRQPVKPEPEFEIKPEAKPQLKPETKPEPKIEPLINPETKPSPPPAEKGPGWLQTFIQNLKKVVFKKIGEKKIGPEEMLKPSREIGLVAPEVTLMPEELPITKRMIQERILILLTIFTFSILLVFIAWLWATWRFEIAQGEINRIRTSMATVEAQIVSYNDLIKEIKDLERKAERVNNLLNNHIYWTKFFKLLETYTIPDVYYGDFNGDVSEKIVLPSVGRNLVAAARQLIAFSHAPDFVQTITITDLTGGVKGVSFNTNLILVPTAFKK